MKVEMNVESIFYAEKKGCVNIFLYICLMVAQKKKTRVKRRQ